MSGNSGDEEAENVRVVLGELMRCMRHQDNLVQGWTKFLMVVQGGLAIGLAHVVNLKLQPRELALVTSLLFPVIGIVSVLAFTKIIRRELFWQGRYVYQVRRLRGLPEMFQENWVPSNPDAETEGHQSRVFVAIGYAITVAWAIIIVCLVRSIN